MQRPGVSIGTTTNNRGNTVKQFIRNVRASKTIADERAVVQKESAAIRASFREESHNSDLRYDHESTYSVGPVFTSLQ